MVVTSKFTVILIEKGDALGGEEGGSQKSCILQGGGGLQGSHIILHDIWMLPNNKDTSF